jgi:hypothetical protein
MPKINELFAFIVADLDEEDEGLLTFKSGDEWLPMIGTDMKRIESLRPIADTIAYQSGKTYRVIRFQAVGEVEFKSPPVPIAGLEFKIEGGQ